MWIKYVILRLATQSDIFMEWPPLLSRSCQPGQFWLSCKIAEFESQCPCYLQQTFRYLSISISFVDFLLPLAPLVSCNVPPLSQLNVASIHCKALKTIEIHCKARTSNVSTCCQFFRLLARDQPIVLKSHLDLFTNHFWICSPNVYAFVPNRLWTWV